MAKLRGPIAMKAAKVYRAGTTLSLLRTPSLLFLKMTLNEGARIIILILQRDRDPPT